MSEVHRYNVVTMLSESGNRIGYDPHGPEVVMASEFDRVTTELAALREELAEANKSFRALGELYSGTQKGFEKSQQRLTASEQRNADLVKLLQECVNTVRFGEDFDLPVTTMTRIDAALKPTESEDL